MSENQKLFALLIDGDNVQTTFIPQILNKLNEYGVPLVLKVFHNKTKLIEWERIAAEYPIQAIWVPNNVTQKNTVDIALVMEAMILLYERRDITGFCIVSTDSDYARLVAHLKSQGKYVLGMGEKATPISLRNACTKFIDLEELVSTTSSAEPSIPTPKEVSVIAEQISDDVFLEMFVKAYEHILEKNIEGKKAQITLRDIKEGMEKLDPLFSLSHYGTLLNFVSKVKSLVETQPDFIRLEEQPGSKPTQHYVFIKLPQNEIEKFRQAYIRASDELKLKDKEGWVKLSVIGDTLRALYPDYEPLIYRDIRHKQLKKVVEKIMLDHPNTIELDNNNLQPQIRMKK